MKINLICPRCGNSSWIRRDDGFECSACGEFSYPEDMSSADEQCLMDTLEERDTELERLWVEFGDVPMNPETECMDEEFLGFPVGTHREEIWKWFDQRYSKGVAYLMYNGIEDYVPETRRLYGLKKLCFECESKDCQFNHGGECRFALVHEVKPSISDETGCLSYEYRETELL